VRLDTGRYRDDPSRVPRAISSDRAREPNVDPQLRDLAVLAVIGLLFLAVVQVLALARRRQHLEDRLAAAHIEIVSLRDRLAEETRPPTQFARMHLRDVALERFARLRLAVPRHPGARDPVLSVIDVVR
jgi:hypothetical protein